MKRIASRLSRLRSYTRKYPKKRIKTLPTYKEAVLNWERGFLNRDLRASKTDKRVTIGLGRK